MSLREWWKKESLFKSIKAVKADDWAGVILLALSLLFLVRAAVSCFSADIWYDELFTMGLSDHSFLELTGFTARDVHPPFYYYYVKIVRGIGSVFFPGLSGIITAKLASLFCFFLIYAYGITKVRKNFGLTCAGLFCFCVTAMPQLSQYTTEIRMYGLALFLVTAAFLHTYDIVKSLADQTDTDHDGSLQALGEKSKNRLVVDWILLFVYGLLAAYTHYFAAVAVAVIYGYLMVTLFFVRKKTKAREYGRYWIRVGLMIGLSVLAYLPWLYAVLNQVSQVKEEYWILPLTLRSLGGCVKFLLKPAFANETVNVLAAVVLFVVYGTAVCYCLFGERAAWNRKTEPDEAKEQAGEVKEQAGEVKEQAGEEKKQSVEAKEQAASPVRQSERGMIAAGLGVLAGVVAFGFLASFLIRPVFIYRYMLPAMGIFWLCFSVSVSRLFNRSKLAVKAAVFALVLITGAVNFKAFTGEEAWKKMQMEETQKALSLVEPEDAVLFNFNHVQGILGYYLENDTYLWGLKPEELIRDMFDGMFSVHSAEEIRALIGSGRKVWFVGSGNAREELIAEWEKSGLSVKEMGSYLLERYWFNLYELK